MFAFPWLAFMGAGAVSVPIIIHLLNRRKFQRVVWAAMRFVQVSVQQNQRRMQIEDLILLLLRCLLLLLLGLAMARPLLQAAGGVLGLKEKVTAVVVLDNSYSMSQTDGEKSRFDRGKDIADKLLQTLPDGSAAAVLAASDTVEEVIPQPTRELAYAAGKLRETSLCDRASNLLPALQRAVDTLKDLPGSRKEIYVITDGQAGAWRQMDDVRRLLGDVKGQIRTHVFIVGQMETKNLGVTNLRSVDPLTVVNQALHYQAEVTNFGATAAPGVQVKLYVDASNAPSDEMLTDTIPAGGSRSVGLSVKLKTEGLHSITVKVPADSLPRDDTRSIVVRAIKQVQVLLVDGDPGREPRESESFFLQEALQPVPPTMRDQFYIQVKTVAPTDLDSQRWADFDAVILANVPELSPAATTSLDKFLRDGRGLIVFPGGNINASFYNDKLYRERGILPASLGEPRGDANQAEKFITFDGAKAKLNHPIASLWLEEGVGSIQTPRFYRTYELQAGAINESAKKAADIGPASTVLWYSDGKPAVMERSWGLGRVVLFSSSASTRWNSLAVTKAFVPLLHRTLGALVAKQDDYLNLRVGQKFVLRAAGDMLGKDALFSRPGEAGKAQDSRRVELLSNETPTLQYDRTDLAGVYTATIGDDKAGQVQIQFAAQANVQEESKLDSLSQEQRTALGTVATLESWKPGMTADDLVKQDRVGAELWIWFAAAALLLALVETAVADWFSYSK